MKVNLSPCLQAKILRGACIYNKQYFSYNLRKLSLQIIKFILIDIYSAKAFFFNLSSTNLVVAASLRQSR